MFCTVKSFKSVAFAAGVSLAALSSAAFAQDELVFSDVNVEASMEAAQNGNAMQVFPEITTDLMTAISSRVPGSDDAADPTIRIDIRKISLNGNPMLTGSNEFNEIEGVVAISGKGGNTPGYSFPVNISAYAADIAVPEGYVAVAPSQDDFYVSMINAFADVVAQQALDFNTGLAGGKK
jgi:hypothetical protein